MSQDNPNPFNQSPNQNPNPQQNPPTNGNTTSSKLSASIARAWKVAAPAVVKAYQTAKPHVLAVWNKIKPQTVKGWTLWIVALGLFFAYRQGYFDFQPNAPELRSSKELGSAYEVFLVDPSEGAQLPRFQETSIMKPFHVVVSFNRLVPQKSYQVQFKLSDASGNQVDDHKPFVFTPSQPSWLVYSPYSPDYESHKPGTWLLEVEVFGLGTIKHRFEVLPPTSEQRRILASHEKAREYAFQAFSHYWLGYNMDSLSTFITATGGNGETPDDTELLYPVSQAPSELAMRFCHHGS